MPKKLNECKIKICKGKLDSHGFCGKHAQRFRRYGDPNYLTPEMVRRKNNRAAQPKLGIAKKTTYLKIHGRHAHRVVMEKHLGRMLNRKEIVHHIDGDKHNNSLENLELMTQSHHMKIHSKEIQQARRKK